MRNENENNIGKIHKKHKDSLDDKLVKTVAASLLAVSAIGAVGAVAAINGMENTPKIEQFSIQPEFQEALNDYEKQYYPLIFGVGVSFSVVFGAYGYALTRMINQKSPVPSFGEKFDEFFDKPRTGTK